MSDMGIRRFGRRGFLRGLISAVPAGLVVAASPREVAAFQTGLVRDEAVVVEGVLVGEPAAAPLGQELFNAEGTVVALITHMEWSRQAIPDWDEHGDGWEHHVAGPITTKLEAVCVVPIRQTDEGFRL